jgi:general secretion pathway protein E
LLEIGALLEQRGLVSEADINEASAVRREIGGDLGTTLIRLGAISEDDLLTAFAAELQLPIVDAATLPTPDVLRDTVARLNIPASWLHDHLAIPWFDSKDGDQTLCIASPRIFDPDIIEAAEHWHTSPARLYIAGTGVVETALGALWGQAVAVEPDIRNTAQLRQLAEEAPAIDFVQGMFAEAISRAASDIHIEPFETVMQVRFRVDGIMTLWQERPRQFFDAVSSRIKLMSLMDIAERRLPQDGRQSIRISGKEVDVRVSSLPTAWGESLVLRFLGKTQSLPTLGDLGVSAADIDQLLRVISHANGLVVVSGPTGSGKTTTVYRLISHLNDGCRKIVTIEDPVEIDLPGVLQMAVRADIGLDFSTGLRSILRQDPDVIFVGEIRDAETARIAVQAALTGHLVITTVHTSSAVGAVTRLLDLGVEDFLLGEVLSGLVAQRLLRRACQACSAQGCSVCKMTGYRGRVGAFEIIGASTPLRVAIRDRSSQDRLAEVARMSGSRGLREDALFKADQGLTTRAEVDRILGPAHDGTHS